MESFFSSEGGDVICALSRCEDVASAIQTFLSNAAGCEEMWEQNRGNAQAFAGLGHIASALAADLKELTTKLMDMRVERLMETMAAKRAAADPNSTIGESPGDSGKD
ncbi:MAG: hypothetical protein ACLQVJ_10400 [Syntrophobacteraceae bacterium]